MSLRPVELRIDDGSHRQANWLELFFDLAFVICISTLSHTLLVSTDLKTIMTYLGFFVPIWWVWNQFTWYASQFDNGDLLFRTLIIAGSGGSIVLADGVLAMVHGQATTFVMAYLFLHAVLALGWLRVYRALPQVRPYSRYKLAGIAAGMVLWSVGLFLSGTWRPCVWALGLAVQMGLPMYAWSKIKTTISVHYHHLLERHGLFAMIVLGESLVALATGLHKGGADQTLLSFIPYFLMVVSLWWIYFDWRFDPGSLRSVVRMFTMNYGHLFSYAGLSLFAVGIGLSFDTSAETRTAMGHVLLCIGSGIFLMALATMSLVSGKLRRREVAVQVSGSCLAWALLAVPSGNYATATLAAILIAVALVPSWR